MAKRNLQKFYLLAGVATAILLLIFLNLMGWLDLPKSFFYRAGSLVLKPFNVAATKTIDFFKTVSSIKDLVRESDRLEKENQELILKLSSFYDLVHENDLLRKQLQISPTLKSRMVMADVVGFDHGNLGQYFFINKGKKDGAAPDQAVIFSGGFLVGEIEEVSDSQSKVRLATDSKSSVPCLTQETRVSGMAKGDYGVGLVMEIIPPEKEIKPNELIITSGLDGHLPKGLIIGQAELVISNESEVFQRIKVKPSINYNELEKVFIVLGKE